MRLLSTNFTCIYRKHKQTSAELERPELHASLRGAACCRGEEWREGSVEPRVVATHHGGTGADAGVDASLHSATPRMRGGIQGGRQRMIRRTWISLNFKIILSELQKRNKGAANRGEADPVPNTLLV